MGGLIVFDFDGVIADSEKLANTVLAEMVSELGTPTTLDDAYTRYMGKRFPEVVAQIERDLAQTLPVDFPVVMQARTLERFREELRAVTGALAFIEAFSGVPKCIASSSSTDRLRVCLDELALRSAFEPHIYSASLVARGKPHPDIFLYAARQVGVSPSRSIVIEDSVGGVEAGLAAGMTVIGLLAASHIRPETRDRLHQAGADHVVDTFAEAKGITSDLLAKWA